MTTYTDPRPGGRPGDPERAQAIAVDLAGSGVHGVVLAYVDTAGIARIKAIPVHRLESASRWGVGMSPVFDGFLANDHIASSETLGTPDGDLRLYPDLDQIVALAAQPGWAWAPVDRITQDGAPHPTCSRTVLRRIVSETEAHLGLTFLASLEIEWSISLPSPEGEFRPAVSGPAYGATRQIELSDYTAEILAALAAQGVDVDQIHPEYAPGQFEVSVGALDPVGAADRSVLVRQTIRAVSQRHGLVVSFSPAVLAEGVGNGGHLHLSAWRGGTNLHSSGTARYGMSEEAESFAAGILRHLPALSAVLTPSPASYLRLKPSQWAGAFVAWGCETREASVRIVRGMVGQRDKAANLEVKSADLAANPYLLLSAVLVAGLDGIAQGSVLPTEITGDPSRYSPSEAAERGVSRLPASLDQAASAFGADDVLRVGLGAALADAILAVRGGETGAVLGLDDAGVAAHYRWKY